MSKIWDFNGEFVNQCVIINTSWLYFPKEKTSKADLEGRSSQLHPNWVEVDDDDGEEMSLICIFNKLLHIIRNTTAQAVKYIILTSSLLLMILFGM